MISLGLDIDGVCANFVEAIIAESKKLELDHHFPGHWQECQSWGISHRFESVWSVVKHSPVFWRMIKPLPGTLEALQDENLTVAYYLTARPIPVNVTKAWLWENDFPYAPVYNVSDPADKLEIVSKNPVDYFVDDLIPTVRQITQAGLPALLFASSYHKGEDLSDLQVIKSLGDIVNL